MTTVLLIYYNQNLSNFYYRQIDPIELLVEDKFLGYKNSYGHEIISILLFIDDTTTSIKNYNDYYYKQKPKNDNKSLRNVLIDRGINLLNKFKK